MPVSFQPVLPSQADYQKMTWGFSLQKKLSVPVSKPVLSLLMAPRIFFFSVSVRESASHADHFTFATDFGEKIQKTDAGWKTNEKNIFKFFFNLKLFGQKHLQAELFDAF